MRKKVRLIIVALFLLATCTGAAAVVMASLYEEQIRVPLLIHVPGAGKRRVTAPVSLIDLPRTLLQLASIETDWTIHGRSRRTATAGSAVRSRGPIWPICCGLTRCSDTAWQLVTT